MLLLNTACVAQPLVNNHFHPHPLSKYPFQGGKKERKAFFIVIIMAALGVVDPVGELASSVCTELNSMEEQPCAKNPGLNYISLNRQKNCLPKHL